MNDPASHAPRWMSTVLRAAGIYNLVWGAWVVLWPEWSLRVCGYPEPLNYPQFWQCIGMIVGVYGIGYWIAASDPVRHWPIVFVGFLGKVLGPIGFLWGYSQGTLPLSAGRINITNDVIWWAPFAAILWHALRTSADRPARDPAPLDLSSAIGTVRSQSGETLSELSAAKPLLLVFLRHVGCTFCLEALSDLAKQRPEIEARGTRIALVHLSDEGVAGELFRQYGLDDLPRFSDPDQRLYQAFGLKQGRFLQLFGWKVLSRGTQAAIFEGHGFGGLQGNGLRMPGVFLLRDGTVVASYRHQTTADRPDYCELASGGRQSTDVRHNGSGL
ncbi:SelL-related redox protein [Planctomicrobium piriforme]|uniref:Peroxiredoxin n=1 Tax=Planctomicrobium piriforme TaxID=1576369 RepID=A0A1I3QM42_9PLAN|nr:SelL-related redox protein [Planctomicrobium piriforme]SFJ34276.1 Peroxiredoxin [Planctomicrobium piriforme]